jgi:long-chain fatty acid transport protein
MRPFIYQLARVFALGGMLTILETSFCSTLRASNILLPGQGSSGLGTAYAGGAAQAEDPSTIYFNPAGIAVLNDGEFQGGLTVAFPTASFSNEGSHYELPGSTFNGRPITGGNGGNPGSPAPAPYFFVSQPVVRSPEYGDVAIGFGLSVPFGLQTDYDSGWVGRYSTLRSKVTAIELEPAIAYRLWDRLSIGVSIDIQRVSAELTQAIDFGEAGYQAVGEFLSSLPAVLEARGVPQGEISGIVASTQQAYRGAGFVPGGRDGVSEVTGNNWGLGYTLGVLFEYLKANKNTVFQDGRLGFSYRSAITQEIQGNAQFRGVPLITAQNAPVQFPVPNLFESTFIDQSASAALNLPDIYHFSIYQRFLQRFAILGDIEWVRWSRLQSVAVKFSNPMTPSVPIVLDYADSVRLALGLEWFARSNLTFRCGFAYDQTPVRSSAFRIPLLPDNDEYTVSLGFRWSPIRLVDIDIGYAHMFIPNGASDVADSQGHLFRGKFSTASDLVSVGATIHWGGPR